MRKIVTLLLGLSLASAAYGGGDSGPPGTDPSSDPTVDPYEICPDGTIIWPGQDCPLLRIETPVETLPPKPHIGWEDPR